MKVASSQNAKQRPRNYFKKQITVLKYCGISFSGNESFVYKLYSFLIISLSVFGYTIIATWELFKHDFETAARVYLYQNAGFMAFIWAFIVWLKRIEFGKVLAKLEQEPFLPNPNRGGDEEERLIQECVWKTNVQAYVIWFSGGGTIVAACAYSVSTRLLSDDYHDWQLSFGPITALNITYSPNFEITWFYQAASLSMAGVYVTTIDLLIASVLMHISYQFKILQYFLKNIVRRSYERMLEETTENQPGGSDQQILDDCIDSSDVSWKYLQKSLKEAVSYHVAIIDIAREMEEYFRYLLMLIFLVTMGFLCFEIFQTSHSTSLANILQNVMEYGTCSFQVAVPCFWGEQVLTESEKVGIAAYDSQFVGTDVRFQKSLILIIRRSQNFVKLTAGKFADVCLATMGSVFRASYTFFMVIRNTNTKTV